jgi:hypothetical protein
MNFTVISAVNNEDVLRSCLISSPSLGAAENVILKRGYKNAASAYNSAIDESRTDILLFIHQDVFLPEGWVEELKLAVGHLNEQDPRWAVAGVWGVEASGLYAGFLYCTGLAKTLGQRFVHPVQVRTLDEVLLVIRKSSGVRFDEGLPGYHLYGTDICMEAQRREMNCYVIPTFCIHNTNGYGMLPWQFWKCYLLLRRKWRARLPIITPCTRITFWCWPAIRWNCMRAVNLLLGRHKPGRRVPDPALLYEELPRSQIQTTLNTDAGRKKSSL